jgi:hypothetical protein
MEKEVFANGRTTQAEFYDIHCHAHTLSHPAFLALIQTLRARRLEAIYKQVTSFEYLASSFFHRGGEKLRNMLSVMENEPGDIFMLMEDDLAGVYAKTENKAPLIEDGLLSIGGQSYGKLVISPLLIDFNQAGTYKPDTYYDKYPKKKIDAQIVDVLLGIRDYRRLRPNGILEIHPFLGINPKAYTAESLVAFLDRWFSGFSRGREKAKADFASMDRLVIGEETNGRSPFAGIKLYPPMGFDPWPSDESEREKVEILYSFCEKREVPIITHCDDGGFRVLPLEEAWHQTSPARYRPALEKFPRLMIDFAHLGNQYSMSLRMTPLTEWREQIFSLMAEYPGVYADFSFNGALPDYYSTLVSALAALPDDRRRIAESRIMFGSDFMVNLLKVPSYIDYFRIFSGSRLEPSLKQAFGSENPRRFLFGD